MRPILRDNPGLLGWATLDSERWENAVLKKPVSWPQESKASKRGLERNDGMITIYHHYPSGDAIWYVSCSTMLPHPDVCSRKDLLSC